MRLLPLRPSRLLAGAAALALVAGPATAATASAATEAAVQAPKNIILMISDGAGYNQFDSTNFYRTGHGAFQVVTGQDGTVRPDPANQPGAEVYMGSDWTQLAMSHYSQSTIDAGYTYDPVAAWSQFDWVKTKATDSAAAGTAMSTGTKTLNGFLGYGADKTTRLTTAGEVAQATGRGLGLVTSVPFNHATPAAFIAHNTDRNDYTGLASEMLDSGATVLMGAGHPGWTDDHTERTPEYTWIDSGDFSSLIGGKTPFRLVEKRADFEALAAATSAPTAQQCRAAIGTQPVFGLAEVAETLQERRAGGTVSDVELGVTPLNDVPSLETMTKAALNRLSQGSNGFFAMVEGGAIDWAGHSNLTGRLIEEQTDFNKAVDAVVSWVETSSSWDETLVIVTADHETGYLAGVDANPSWTPMAGEKDRLPNVTWHSGSHTNALVPVFAKGAGAERLVAVADEKDPVRGAYLDNTELGTVMHELMRAMPVSAQTGALTDPCAGLPAEAETAQPTEQPAPEESAAPSPAASDVVSEVAAPAPAASEPAQLVAAKPAGKPTVSAPAPRALARTGAQVTGLAVAAVGAVAAGVIVLLRRRLRGTGER